MERHWAHTVDMLQPLIPKMSAASLRTYGSTVHSTQIETEKTSPPCTANNDDIGHDGAAFLETRSARYNVLKAIIAGIVIGFSTVWWFSGNDDPSTQTLEIVTAAPTVLPKIGARASKSPLLEVFQVYPPVLTVARNGALEITDDTPGEGAQSTGSYQSVCEEVLAVHSFGYSYGQPFISSYTSPGCDFNRVTWNLTVVSAGRQFDRLGIVYLGDTEVFRTSTAEPTANGIRWTYLKVSTPSLPVITQSH